MTSWRDRVTPLDPYDEFRTKMQQTAAQNGGYAENNAPAPVNPPPLPDGGVTWRDRLQPIAKAAPQPTQAPQPAPKTSWRDRVKPLAGDIKLSDVEDDNYVSYGDERAKRMAESAVAGAEGKQTVAETLYQTAMEGGSRFTDIVNEGVKAVTPTVLKMIDANPMLGGDPMNMVTGRKGMASLIAETLPTALSSALSLPAIMEAYSGFEKEHPRAGRNLRATGQALNLATAGIGLNVAKNAVKGEVSAAKKAIAAEPKPPSVQQTLSQAKKESYDTAAWQGAKYTPEQVGNNVDDLVRQTEPKPMANGQLTSEELDLAKDIREFGGWRGKTMSLDELDRLDKNLSDKIHSKYLDPRTGDYTNNGRLLLQMQRKIRALADAAPTAGNDALTNGRQFYAAERRVRDINDVFRRAEVAPGDKDKALQAGFRALYNDKDGLIGWPDEAVEALKVAATPGWTREMLGPIVQKLTSTIMLGSGNVAGAAGVHAASLAAKGARTAATVKRGTKVQDALAADAFAKERPVKIDAPEYPPQGLLPPPDKMSALPMTEQQVNIAQRLMNRPTRLKPDAPIKDTAPKRLASPDKMSALPMGGKELTVAQRLLTNPPKPNTTVLKTPVSQLNKIYDTVGKSRRNQLDRMRSELHNGQISQNKFVKSAKASFGLSEQQARSLVKEILTYGDK